MRKTMLGLVLAALMTAGLGSAAWAEPAPAVQYPASAVEAVAAGSDYTYEELLACLTGAGCTEAEALAWDPASAGLGDYLADECTGKPGASMGEYWVETRG